MSNGRIVSGVSRGGYRSDYFDGAHAELREAPALAAAKKFRADGAVTVFQGQVFQRQFYSLRRPTQAPMFAAHHGGRG